MSMGEDGKDGGARKLPFAKMVRLRDGGSAFGADAAVIAYVAHYLDVDNVTRAGSITRS